MIKSSINIWMKDLKIPVTDKDVLYEDNHLIAINKRAGDLVQANTSSDEPLDEKVKKIHCR